MSPSETKAAARLSERQSKRPPIYPRNSRGFDRGRALAGVLVDSLPAELKALAESGEVVVGEIGEFKPSVATYPVEGQEFCVEMTTGLMDFYYAVGRAIGGLIAIYTDSTTPVVRATQGPTAVAESIAANFQQWKSFAEQGWLDRIFVSLPRVSRSDFALDIRAMDIVERLVTGAEIFMIAHEFGHVAMGRGLAEPPHVNEELSADTLGVEFFTPAAMDHHFGLRTTLACAAFSMRILAGLERVGVAFGPVYPPARDRIENLQRSFRARYCPNEQYYDEASTIMVNYEDLLDAVDNLITPGSAPKTPDAWRARVRIIAELQEVAMKRLAPERFARHLRLIAEARPATEMAAIIAALRDYYLSQGTRVAYLPPATRRDMGEALGAALKATQLA